MCSKGFPSWFKFGWEKFRIFFLWTPAFEKNETYEEETVPTDSIRIQGNNELESKTDKLESKTNGDIDGSFPGKASKMFDNFLKTVKEDIKN